MKFATKPIRHYPPHLMHVAALPWEIENSNFCRYSADIEENANTNTDTDTDEYPSPVISQRTVLWVRGLSSSLKTKSLNCLNVFGRPFAKRFALCYRTIVLYVCPVCLWHWCIVAKRLDGSRWNVACTWPHCISWGPSSFSPKGHSSPVFGPCLLWPNGWVD